MQIPGARGAPYAPRAPDILPRRPIRLPMELEYGLLMRDL
jgi:hypothetical protein